MDTTYSYLGPTLFPTREDITTVGAYDECWNTEVDRIDSIVDRLWADPPATPRDASTDYTFREADEDDRYDDVMWSGLIAHMFGF